METMKITDEKLYQLCKKYGTAALLWRRKFTGLLPEANRRRLYEKKGFSSIFEFSFKLCGLSADQVRLALNLERRFEDKPALRKILEEGEASINKLSRIVSIATIENQEELAEKVKILPKSALETLVKDEKFAMKNDTEIGGLFGENASQNGLDKPLFVDKSLPGQMLGVAKRSLSFGTGCCTDSDSLSFKLADDVKKELEELNFKGIDVNEFLRKALKQRKEEIEEKKEEIAKELEDTKERNDARIQTDNQQAIGQNEKLIDLASATTTKPSRYIPAKVKKIIKEEHGTKCSIPTCQKPAEVIHHTQTFSLSHSHDPRFLAPLCKEHHAIAHSMDVKYHEMRNGSR